MMSDILCIYFQAEQADKLVVAAILTLPELYYRPKTVDELVDYVELISRVAPNTPILYYHHPKNSNVECKLPGI